MPYSQQALIVSCSACFLGIELPKGTNITEPALRALAKALKSLTPSKLFAPTGNSLRLCAMPRVKSSFRLGDIGSHGT